VLKKLGGARDNLEAYKLSGVAKSSARPLWTTLVELHLFVGVRNNFPSGWLERIIRLTELVKTGGIQPSTGIPQTCKQLQFPLCQNQTQEFSSITMPTQLLMSRTFSHQTAFDESE